MTALIKFLPAFIALAIGVVGGAIGGSRIATKSAQAAVVPCNCNCPPAAQLDLGNLELGKINNKRGELHLQIDQKFDHVSIVVDSATFAALMKQVGK